MKDSKRFGLISASFFAFAVFLASVLPIRGQQLPRPTYNKPAELQATDPEIRTMLDDTRSACDQANLNDTVERVQKALRIADNRGLVGDRALAEAMLASAYIGQAEIELAFTTFQKALQDAIDSKNGVLEADILISLSSEAQMKGNTLQAIHVISKALSIAEKNRSLYEKARALGELGRLKLVLGRIDEAAEAVDEALEIDKLNGYKFEALHLVYRGYYLGLTGKLDQAIESLVQARTKALSANDAYSFIMAENAYAFGLVQKGRTDEAIADLSLLKEGKLQKFVQDAKEQACIASALELPVLHLTFLEGLTNVYAAANQKEKELDTWLATFSYSRDHGVVAGEAEAAEKVANLNNQFKKSEEALKYYGIAADLFRQLQNEASLNQVEVSQSLLLVQIGRGKEALPIIREIVSFAKRHNLRTLEFGAYLELAQIYQPTGDLDQAREALERAESLVHPGPFDSEIDNHLVLEAYSRLSDIYRTKGIPAKELISIEKAFSTAYHLKDDKAQQTLVVYLDQRLFDLRIREQTDRLQKDGQLVEALVYSYIVLERDGVPAKPHDDASNWNRVLTLPFEIAQKPGGDAALIEILDEMGPLLGFEKLSMLDALSRHYIATGSDPSLAEKYALQSEALVNNSKGSLEPLKVNSACVLAIAYSRQFKTDLAKTHLLECLRLADETKDKQTILFAQAANVMVQFQTGDIASAKNSLEQLIASAPDQPELHVELAMSLASGKLYDEAASQLDFAVTKLSAIGDKKTAAGAYARVAIALNSDSSEKAKRLQLQYLKTAQSIYHERAWFLERISRLRGQMNAGNPDLVSLPICEVLFKTLFPGKAENVVAAAQELVVIPDDALFLLPFELYSPKASALDFVLIQKPITYYPSAVAFQFARAAGRLSGWQEALLGLADPITSPEDERYAVIQVMPSTISQGRERQTGVRKPQGDSPEELGRLQSRGFSLERLPGTSIEIQSIVALFRKANEPVELRVGAEATRQKLLDTDLSQFRFLHFATHGVLPVDTNIKEPALVLSYDGISPMHMFLTMSDILNFKLHSESVVLSACNTGSGSVSRAEGVMSLGRAFLGAGASSVTVSLWQVSDESTALLMQEYYRRILEGKKKNVALAEARYTVFSKGQKAPFFWAPFILIGE